LFLIFAICLLIFIYLFLRVLCGLCGEKLKKKPGVTKTAAGLYCGAMVFVQTLLPGDGHSSSLWVWHHHQR
jgi:hypothetical protein